MVSLSYNFLDVEIEGFNSRGLTSWIKSVLKHYDIKNAKLDYIFVDDNYLLEMNVRHLNHNYYTDIITFNYNEKSSLCGEMFISVDRVKENSKMFSGDDFELELCRVMIHGVLHLIGLDDKSDEDEKAMRLAEEECLKLRSVSRET